MRKAKSILMYGSRSSFYKSILISLGMALVQILIYLYWIKKYDKNFNLPSNFYNIKFEWVFLIGLILVACINRSTGTDREGSKSSYFLNRLSMDGKIINNSFFMIFSLNYICYFLIALITMTGIIYFTIVNLGMKDVFINIAVVSYLYPYFHMLLPLRDIAELVLLVFGILTMTMTDVYSSMKSRNGEKSYMNYIYIAVYYFLCFTPELSGKVLLIIISNIIIAYCYSECFLDGRSFFQKVVK